MNKILGKLIGKTVLVEDGCYIGKDTTIVSDYIHIKKNTTIKGLTAHVPDKFIVGECSHIGNNTNFKCRSLEIGSYLWSVDGVEIGRGGCDGPNSSVKIGDGCMLCEGVMINPSEAVSIGDDVGIGTNVQIWTHGSFLDIMNGFPAIFKSVTIGSHVWIPANVIVLPGVTIGNNVVIGIGSLVNKSIPDGCLAGGVPIKVLKENIYPKDLTGDEKRTTIEELIRIWTTEIVPFKGIKTVSSIGYHDFNETITLTQGEKETVYDISNRTIVGHEDDVTEDFRDFLRRRGVKFFTGKPFKSITAPIFVK
jgi:acetyltransferase-like isoleucine patch superfamily enzyme